MPQEPQCVVPEPEDVRSPSPSSGEELGPSDEPAPVPGGQSASGGVGRYQFGAPDEQRLLPVRDRILDRQAVGRMVPLAKADDLEREARFIARLDHSGTPGVLDFIRNDTGAILVTRKVDGITLSEAVARAISGSPPPELATPSLVAQAMIRVCEALAAAHARGVVHRQVCPDNILLGWQGQVVVQDWSRAMAENARPMTIRYISSTVPSAVTDLDGLHLDLRGVGQCLFFALVWRLPVAAGGDPLGQLTAKERSRAPDRLLAIARGAMVSDAARGFETMLALQRDLECFLAGSEPTAYVPGLLTRSLRFVRAHALASLAIAAVIVAAAVVYLPPIRDRLAWGSPIQVEDFSDNGWKNRWMEPSLNGMFQVQKGRLVSIAARGADLIYRERLTTPLAIEYTGEILDGSRPCDLSVVWREGSLEQTEGFLQSSGRSILMQFGAFGNTCMRIGYDASNMSAAFSNQTLESGRKYRFRVEIEGGHVAMLMDGRKILEYQDLCPFFAGRIALYAHFPGKAFDDVRIYQKSPPESVSPLSLGDTFLANGKFEQSLPIYSLVAESYGERPIGQQAQFRKGVAEWSLGHRDQALSSWAKVTSPELQKQVDGYAVMARSAQQQDAFCARFTAHYQQDADARPGLRQDWYGIMQRLSTEPAADPRLVDRCLKLRQDLFPKDEMAIHLATTVLLIHDRLEDTLRLFPEDKTAISAVLIGLGRTQEVLDAPWTAHDSRSKAWQMRGEYDKMIADQETIQDWRIGALCMADRAVEGLADPSCRYPIFLHLGRASELLELPALTPRMANEALIAMGRFAEAAGPGLARFPGSGNDTVANLMLGDIAAAERGGQPQHAYRFMQAVEFGDESAIGRLRPLLQMSKNLSRHGGWFTASIVGPLVDRWRGDAQALEGQMRPKLPLYAGIYGKRPWFLARAMLGETPPAEVLKLPAVAEAPAWHAVTLGICEELAGRPAESIAAYTDFIQMPLHRRLLMLHTPDPEVEWFVRWRLRALQR